MDDAALPMRLPGPPRLVLHTPTVAQRYHVEIWVEKTTMDDVLKPLAQEYGCNLVQGAGEQSVTRCDELVWRAQASGRPVRIIYIADFDPAGLSIPLTVARKLEYHLNSNRLDLDIQVRRVALTLEQCNEYDLPRTPIKLTENRKSAFEARWGRGATELDALEALHPGVLRRIIKAELDRYYDHDLKGAVHDAAGQWREHLDRHSRAAANEHAEDLAALQTEYAELRARDAAAVWNDILNLVKLQPDEDEHNKVVGGLLKLTRHCHSCSTVFLGRAGRR
jgi:hypothetical protein